MAYISWSSDFALYWRLFDVWTSYFRIMNQYDPTLDLKINVGRFDLCFMVLWFCLISWSLFDRWTPYFGIMSQLTVWPDVRPENNCRSLWPIFHGPVILPYILKTVCNFILQDYESVWPNILPQDKYRSLWPIFHGSVILPYILKTIWYINTILSFMSQYDPMFDLK